MSDHQPQQNSGSPATHNLLLTISSVAILAVLVAIAGLMYSLNRKLDSLGQIAPATAPVVPQPAVAAMPPSAAPAAAPAPVPRATPRPAVNRNYTGRTRETAASIPPHDHAVSSLATVQAAPAAAAPAPLPVAVSPPPASFPPTQVASAPAPRPARASLPTGSILTVRLIQSLSSETNRPGDRFSASLDEPIYANGIVAVPVGATVEGRVVRSEQAGRVSGLAELGVQLDRLQLPSGESVNLATEIVSRQGEATRGQDVAKVGVGAAIGAAIGAISAGRRGAGIGAATGAGAGAADVLLTRGKPVVLSPETRLSFSLAAPVEFEAGGYSQTTSATPAEGVTPVWPAPRYNDDPFAGQRPRLRRRMM